MAERFMLIYHKLSCFGYHILQNKPKAMLLTQLSGHWSGGDINKYCKILWMTIFNNHHWITGILWCFSEELILSLNDCMRNIKLQWYFVLMSSENIVNWQTNFKNVLELRGFTGSGKIGYCSIASYTNCYGGLIS